MKSFLYKFYNICVLLFFFSIIIGQKKGEIRLQTVNPINSIPNFEIGSIVQDSLGFIWFTTTNYIARYDGHHIELFSQKGNDSTSGKQSFNGNVFKSKKKCIYFVENGLFEYNYKLHSAKKIFSTSEGIINLVDDSLGNLWLTSAHKLYHYNFQLTKLSILYDCEENKSGIGELNGIDYNEINKTIIVGTKYGKFILIDTKLFYNKIKYNPDIIKVNGHGDYDIEQPEYLNNFNEIWIFNNGHHAISVLDNKTKKLIPILEKYPFLKNYTDELSKSSNSLTYSNEETWFFSTESKEILVLNSKNKTVRKIEDLPPISTIIKDNSGIVWFGSNCLYKYDPKDKNTVFHSSLTVKLNFRNESDVVYYDDKGIWCNNINHGIAFYDSSFNFIRNFNIKNKSTIQFGFVSDIKRIGNLLFVGRNNLNIFDLKDNNFAFANPKENVKGALPGWVIWKLYFSKKTGRLWLGTPVGLFWIDSTNISNLVKHPINGELPNFFHSFNSETNNIQFVNNTVWDIIEDSIGNLWINYNNGILKYNQTNNTSKYYSSFDTKYTKFILDTRSLLLGDNNRIFIGSESLGISILNIKTEEFTKINLNSYVKVPYIKSMIQDNNGDYWFGLVDGIIKMNKNDGQISLYTIHNGNANTECYHHAVTKSTDGTLYFGTNNGVTYFNPSDLKVSLVKPSPLITGIEVMGEELEPGKKIGSKIITSVSAPYLKDLILIYNQNRISINFSAMHYADPSQNQYLYKLEGVDKDWVKSSLNIASATYVLQPGDYKFYLKASNNDLIWSNNYCMLDIHVLPPFYKTWWFRILIILTIISITFIYIRYRTWRILRQNILLEKQVKERTIEIEKQKNVLQETNQLLEEKQEEIIVQATQLAENNELLTLANATKDKFFSIIGHDLRNPFHGVTSFTELLINRFNEINDEKKIEFLNRIYSSSQSVSNLLDNLLEWSRSQIGMIEKKVEVFHIDEIVTQNFVLLQLNAEEKNIKLIKKISAESIVNADKNLLTTVIRNLLNNAIKFTETNGEIIVKSSVNNNELKIDIIDSGIGMNQEKASGLFKLNKNSSTFGTAGEKGTGLGLLICKEFIELNNGKIEVKSEIGKGSCFSIYLPFDHSQAAIYKDENKNNFSDIITQQVQSHESAIITNTIDSKLCAIHENKVILIIEDNDDIRNNLILQLNTSYKILAAENGEVGLKLAFEELPDVIISDVNMPIKNGFEVCDIIKNDSRSSHIPVILLTALKEDDNKIIGIKTGADDYITKPFNSSILRARIDNLIQIRQVLKDKFSKEININPSEYTTSAADAEFIQKSIDYIESHMSDQDLNLEVLGDHLNISKSNLWRKFKSITDQSPADFVRIIRLKKAARLLLEGYKINQVMFETGFVEQAHFSKTFKKQFGMSPSEFAEQRMKS